MLAVVRAKAGRALDLDEMPGGGVHSLPVSQLHVAAGGTASRKQQGTEPGDLMWQPPRVMEISVRDLFEAPFARLQHDRWVRVALLYDGIPGQLVEDIARQDALVFLVKVSS